MTILTQKKLNLQMKILKIAKGLNKFTLSDILSMLEETVKRICLKGNYVVKPNKEADLEGKYLIKRSSLKLYDFLEDSERRAMDIKKSRNFSITKRKNACMLWLLIEGKSLYIDT